MDPVVHFEMPNKDRERVKKFYSEVFGWKMNQMDEKMGNYIVAHTTETDEKTRMVKTPGAINGGFYTVTDDPASHAPHVVISVKDLEASMKKVTEGGGKVVDKPMDIPGIGKFIVIFDTEGNRVALLQPMERGQH